MDPRAAQLIERLALAPHPEGGFFREAFRSTRRVRAGEPPAERRALTSIYFLLVAGTHSRWHRVASDEAWHFYEGEPLELWCVGADLAGPCSRHVLGPLATTDGPVRVVPAQAWQAARPLGAYTLVGCTVGPGFEYADFALLADDPAAGAFRDRFPALAVLI